MFRVAPYRLPAIGPRANGQRAPASARSRPPDAPPVVLESRHGAASANRCPTIRATSFTLRSTAGSVSSVRHRIRRGADIFRSLLEKVRSVARGQSGAGEDARRCIDRCVCTTGFEFSGSPEYGSSRSYLSKPISIAGPGLRPKYYARRSRT